MASKDLVSTGKKALRYKTRMLTAGEPLTVDGPKARLYEAMGWAEPKPKRTKRPQLDHDGDGKAGGSPKPEGDLTELRAEYVEKLGKRPFMGWDAATLREKIDASQA